MGTPSHHEARRTVYMYAKVLVATHPRAHRTSKPCMPSPAIQIPFPLWPRKRKAGSLPHRCSGERPSALGANQPTNRPAQLATSLLKDICQESRPAIAVYFWRVRQVLIHGSVYRPRQ